MSPGNFFGLICKHPVTYLPDYNLSKELILTSAAEDQIEYTLTGLSNLPCLWLFFVILWYLLIDSIKCVNHQLIVVDFFIHNGIVSYKLKMYILV